MSNVLSYEDRNRPEHSFEPCECKDLPYIHCTALMPNKKCCLMDEFSSCHRVEVKHEQ